MHILLIHQFFLEKNDSGGSRFNEMTRFWEEQGHQVTVLAGMIHGQGSQKYERYKGKFLHDEQYSPNIRVIRSHVSESYNVNFIGRLWGYFSYTFSSILAGLFKARGKYDVIVVTSPPLFVAITAYVLSVFKRIPFIFEIRDLWPQAAIDLGFITNPAMVRFLYWFEGFIYRKALLINVLTPAFRDNLVAKGIPDDKICFIPNAADFSIAEKLQQTNFDAQAFRKEHNLENRFVITYVGAHGAMNRLIQLVEVADRFRISNPEVLFLLIGEGMEKKMLQEAVSSRGLENIRLLAPVPKTEVFKYILASDLGASVLMKADIMKTVYSNKTFDYMSCRKPILMAIDGISRDLVEQAHCGVFVEPENINDFEQKIRGYLGSAERITSEGENGYRYAKTHFDRKVLALKYLDFIENAVRNSH